MFLSHEMWDSVRVWLLCSICCRIKSKADVRSGRIVNKTVFIGFKSSCISLQFYGLSVSIPPGELLYQVNLFSSAPVVIISLNMVSPAFAFLNTSSGGWFCFHFCIFFFIEEKIFLIIGSSLLWKRQFTVVIFLGWNKYSLKGRMNIFFNKLFVQTIFLSSSVVKLVPYLKQDDRPLPLFRKALKLVLQNRSIHSSGS